MHVAMKDVSFRYPGNREPVLQVDEMNLSHDQRIHVVIGPNASGKTTFCKLMCGILRSPGVIVSDPPPVLVWQDLQLFPTTVATNLELVCPERRRRESLLDRFGLGAYGKAAVSELSGGQRTKLALARALATNREIIVFDEPTAALDPRFVDSFGSELLSMTEITRVVVTHDRSFLSLLVAASEAFVYVLEPGRAGGRLSRGWPARQFVRQPPTVYAAQFLGYENILSVPGVEPLRRTLRLDLVAGPGEMRHRIVLPLEELELSNSSLSGSIPVVNPREEFRAGGARVVRVDWIRGGGLSKLEFVASRGSTNLDEVLFLGMRSGKSILELEGA